MRIGILGGGQLAMMMVQQSEDTNFDFLILDPTESPPASKYATCIKAEYDDIGSLNYIADECDVVTIDFENVPADTLRFLEKRIVVAPSSSAVEICQDRLKEKELFINCGIPVTKYTSVYDNDSLKASIDYMGKNSILKTRFLGYDGKNQFDMEKVDGIDYLKECKSNQLILEKKVDFEKEISKIGVRMNTGKILFYPLVENIHKNGILNYSIAPYDDKKLQKLAEEYHKKISDKLNYVGVLVIEFFLDKNGILIANEMAPRVHNSGHWTNEGANINQFQAHIKAVANCELESISIKNHSAMVNILSKKPDLKNIKDFDYTYYDYNKSERHNRKLGHITLNNKNRDKLMQDLNTVYNFIKT